MYLAAKPSFYLRDGVDNSSSKTGYSVTDANGRFALPGGNGTAQKLVAASADGRLFQIAAQTQLNQDIRIKLLAFVDDTRMTNQNTGSWLG